MSGHPLGQFRAIYLLNVDWLDEAACVALEKYVAEGGGLGIFLGERTQSRFINGRLYKEGQGSPMPLAAQEAPAPRLPAKAARPLRAEHPDLRGLRRRGKVPPLVNVFRYWTVRRGWRPDAEKDVEVIATRNQAPLAAEKQFGRGT